MHPLNLSHGSGGHLRTLVDAEREAECLRNDLKLRTFTRADMHRALQSNRHPRTSGEAFRDAEYAKWFHPPQPSAWRRLLRVIKERLA